MTAPFFRRCCANCLQAGPTINYRKEKQTDEKTHVEIETKDWTPAFSKTANRTTIQKVSGKCLTALRLKAPDFETPECRFPLV